MPLALTPSPISTHEVAYLGTRLSASRTQTLRVLRTGQSLETPDLQFAHAILSGAETSPANEILFFRAQEICEPSSFVLLPSFSNPILSSGAVLPIVNSGIRGCRICIQSVRRPFYSLCSFGFAYIKKGKGLFSDLEFSRTFQFSGERTV